MICRKISDEAKIRVSILSEYFIRRPSLTLHGEPSVVLPHGEPRYDDHACHYVLIYNIMEIIKNDIFE
mgnify:CR=1 FL=1